jgi:hypothetical protein
VHCVGLCCTITLQCMVQKHNINVNYRHTTVYHRRQIGSLQRPQTLRYSTDTRKRIYTHISEQGGIRIHVSVLFVKAGEYLPQSARLWCSQDIKCYLRVFARTLALNSEHPSCLWIHFISLLNEKVQSVLQCFVSYECYEGSTSYPFV